MKSDAGDPAQRFTVSNDLLRHFVGVADQQGAMRTALCVETRAGCGRPAALLRDAGDGAGVAGEIGIGSLPRRGCDIAQRVYADLRSSVSPAGRSNGSVTKYRFRFGSSSRTRRTEEVTWPAADESKSNRYLACQAHTSPLASTPLPSRPPSGLPNRWNCTPGGHATTPCSMRIDPSSSNALERERRQAHSSPDYSEALRGSRPGKLRCDRASHPKILRR